MMSAPAPAPAFVSMCAWCKSVYTRTRTRTQTRKKREKNAKKTPQTHRCPTLLLLSPTPACSRLAAVVDSMPRRIEKALSYRENKTPNKKNIQQSIETHAQQTHTWEKSRREIMCASHSRLPYIYIYQVHVTQITKLIN